MGIKKNFGLKVNFKNLIRGREVWEKEKERYKCKDEKIRI